VQAAEVRAAAAYKAGYKAGLIEAGAATAAPADAPLCPNTARTPATGSTQHGSQLSAGSRQQAAPSLCAQLGQQAAQRSPSTARTPASVLHGSQLSGHAPAGLQTAKAMACLWQPAQAAQQGGSAHSVLSQRSSTEASASSMQGVEVGGKPAAPCVQRGQQTAPAPAGAQRCPSPARTPASVLHGSQLSGHAPAGLQTAKAMACLWQPAQAAQQGGSAHLVSQRSSTEASASSMQGVEVGGTPAAPCVQRGQQTAPAPAGAQRCPSPAHTPASVLHGRQLSGHAPSVLQTAKAMICLWKRAQAAQQGSSAHSAMASASSMRAVEVGGKPAAPCAQRGQLAAPALAQPSAQLLSAACRQVRTDGTSAGMGWELQPPARFGNGLGGRGAAWEGVDWTTGVAPLGTYRQNTPGGTASRVAMGGDAGKISGMQLF
jgi:hypothetical protein